MGAWGSNIFQSDIELDTVSDLGGDVSKLAKDPNIDLWYPDNREEVVTKLNNGIFDTLYDRYKAIRGKYELFYFAAISMQLGVNTSKDQIKYLKTVARRIDTSNEAPKQVLQALKDYKSGEPYEFDSPGLDETVMMMAAEQDQKGKSFFGDWESWADTM